jgi:hypothetical protein
MKELGLDAISEPAHDNDHASDTTNTARSEDEKSDNSDYWSPDEVDEELKPDTVRVPLELWKAMEKFQDMVVNERLKTPGRDKVYDDRISLASVASTDCPGTDFENMSNSSSDAADCATRSGKLQLPGFVQAAPPPRVAIAQPVASGLSLLAPATVHVLHRQSLPVGVRVLSPAPLPRASFGCLSPRESLSSTTVSHSVNVKTSISTGGNSISVTTNVQTSTKIDLSVYM